MAAYPSFPQLIGTKLTPDAGIQTDRAVSGKPRFRTRYSQIWRAGVIIHELDQTQLDTLDAFYQANKNVAFTFTYAADNTEYNLQFMGCPDPTPKSGGFYDVVVQVAEV